MPPGVYLKVQGAAQLGSIARQLREAGDKTLQRELYAGLNRAVKPIRPVVQAAARDAIGDKHGYGPKVASSLRVTARRRVGRNPSVTLVARRGNTPLRALDSGQLRHPTFGRWKTSDGRSLAAVTRVKAGWWDAAIRSQAPEIRREIAKTITHVRAQLRRA